MILIPLLLALQAAPAPAASPAPSGHGELFLSPMGEPFRGASPQLLWFDRADANHDGVLTRAEFEADAARFFAVLDREHDGEIDPGDIDDYETRLVPEIRVPYNESDAVEQNGGSTSDSEEQTPHVAYPDRQGAGRFGWFDYPEPISICDTSFNRGVDANEFKKCADDRFAVLDSDHDGNLRRNELPSVHASPRAPARGDHRQHGQHRRGMTAGMFGGGS